MPKFVPKTVPIPGVPHPEATKYPYRVTVDFTPATFAELESISRRTGIKKLDVVRMIVHDFLVREQRTRGGVYGETGPAIPGVLE